MVKQHGHHMLLLFGKTLLFAINKAWIKLSLCGDTSFNVLFIVEYQFCAGTSFSLDTWRNFHTRTCHLSCLASPLCNISRKLQILIFVQRTHFIPFDRFHGQNCE